MTNKYACSMRAFDVSASESHSLLELILFSSCLLCLLNSGCASLPYPYGAESCYKTSESLLVLNEQPIERGHPVPLLDAAGWVFGIPRKLVLWDRRVESHQIGEETEAAISEYLEKNDLQTVKVRINQYHPGDDWRRLVANKSVGAGWRYTLGTLSIFGEAIVPGRLFGGDHYNPFSDTIHLYSDVPSIALHEAGHSKDFALRTWKGTYAAAYLLPAVPLYHEAMATNDALGFVMTEGEMADQREAYEILYPAYGSYVGKAIDQGNGLGYLAAVIGGHIAGRIKSAQLSSAKSNLANSRKEHKEPDWNNSRSVSPPTDVSGDSAQVRLDRKLSIPFE